MSYHYSESSFAMIEQSSKPHKVPHGTTESVPSKSDCHHDIRYSENEHGRHDYYHEYPRYTPSPYAYHHCYYWQSPHESKWAHDRSQDTPPVDCHSPPAKSTWRDFPESAGFPQPRNTPPATVTPTRPTKQVSMESSNNTNDGVIWDLQDFDIVCGRGAPVNWQRGNHFFRDLISEYQTVYLCAKRCDKPKIATEIMEGIKARGGRFVRRVKTSYRGRFGWEEIPEKRAYEKICQSLREGAPELRRKMIASSVQLRLDATPALKDESAILPQYSLEM